MSGPVRVHTCSLIFNIKSSVGPVSPSVRLLRVKLYYCVARKAQGL